MAARKQKRMSAQTVEDEDCQLWYERVAAIDVAKNSAVVCLRLPPEPGKTRRTSRTREVTARVPDIEALAVELTAAGYARGPVKAKHAALARAFTGMRSGPEHAFAAAPDLRMITMLDAGTEALEARIREHIAAIFPGAPGGGRGRDHRARRRDRAGRRRAARHATGRLAEIPGVSPALAAGRSILIIVWHLPKDPAARYLDLGPDHHAKHTDANRKARGRKRQPEALGYDAVRTLRETA